MIAYLINTTLCAGLFYAVYSLAFEKEKIHRFKRIYLLFSLIFSLTVPLIKANWFIPEKITENIEVLYMGFPQIKSENIPVQEENTTVNAGEIRTLKPFNSLLIIVTLYAAIALIFFVRLLRNFFIIALPSKNRKKEIFHYFDTNIILIPENVIPHSFGKYIFVNREDYLNGQIPEEILIHEQTHIRQKHFLDILFIETLIAVFWFNPVFYLYRNKIRLNHEFLADETVVRNKGNVFHYQQLLINSINKKRSIALASDFNFLITKKRLLMMTKTTSKKRAWCKMVALIPLFAAAIFVFSSKTLAQNDSGLGVSNNPAPNDTKTITLGAGVSNELMAEYESIVSKYIDSIQVKRNGKDSIFHWNSNVSSDDLKRLFPIFAEMNREQRSKQILLISTPIFGKQSEKPKVPSSKNWKNWSDSKEYKIQIDGEFVENVKLKTVNRWNIVNYWRTQSDIYLWTKNGYDEFLKQYNPAVSNEQLWTFEPDPGYIVAILENKNKENGRIYLMSSSIYK